MCYLDPFSLVVNCRFREILSILMVVSSVVADPQLNPKETRLDKQKDKGIEKIRTGYRHRNQSNDILRYDLVLKASTSRVGIAFGETRMRKAAQTTKEKSGHWSRHRKHTGY